MNKRCLIFIIVTVFIACNSLASAAGSDADAESLFEMSLEDLLDVTIYSASRYEQKVSEAIVPISIVTSEDIHNSGATSIPEILQYVAGVDVYKVDRSRYLVGVHGMQSLLSDRTLVLIDGRNALNPLLGAPDWLSLPVMMEDIERIEVVRGPGGAVWGANAYTGIINIITKKPAGSNNTFISTAVDEHGDTYTHLRNSGFNDKWSWRLSAGYDNVTDSDDAGAGTYEIGSHAAPLSALLPISSYPVSDYSRTFKFDSMATYDDSDMVQYTFGAAYSHMTSGDYENWGRFPMEPEQRDTIRLSARADYSLDNETTAHLQWYGNYMLADQPTIVDKNGYYENDIEGQISFPIWDNHRVTAGGNLRWVHIKTENEDVPGEIAFSSNSFNEQWGGVFLVDRITVNDRLELELQGRLDHYSITGWDWSSRIGALYALDEAHNHILRLAVSRAFRAPNTNLRNGTLVGFADYGGLIQVILDPSGKQISNEKTYSIETGYTGKLSDHVRLSLDAYYQRMEDLIGPVTSFVGPASVSYFTNMDGANAYGGNLELVYDEGPLKLSGFYSVDNLHTDEDSQNIRAVLPAQNKTGIRARWTMDKDWTLNASYAYRDSSLLNVSAPSPLVIKSRHLLDVSVSRKIFDGTGELAIGVKDLLNNTTAAAYDVGDLTSHETPGRTFFARLQMNF